MAPSSNAQALSEAPRPVETMHEDMILDYYGRKLATCSSDRTVKVFDVVDGNASGQGETLRGGRSGKWLGLTLNLGLSSLLLRTMEKSSSGRTMARDLALLAPTLTDPMVNSIAWAPHELGSVLACASSDGNVSVLTFNNDGTWAVDMVAAHPIGCNAVSWQPATQPGSLLTGQTAGDANGAQSSPIRRFASAGCDNVIKIWELSQEQNRWVEVEQLTGHTDWIRDVCFSPNIGLPRSYLASASQDRTVLVWTKDGSGPWTKTKLSPGGTAAGDDGKFKDTVWRTSFSLSGNVLAVSCGDGKVYLFKEASREAGIASASLLLKM
ncbi:hypothetical protein L7F22_006410 [Adiantum nelumboides]|nr:hypothetical protein [Adiantum nelumboides]